MSIKSNLITLVAFLNYDVPLHRSGLHAVINARFYNYAIPTGLMLKYLYNHSQLIPTVLRLF